MKLNNILTLLIFSAFITTSCNSTKELYGDNITATETVFTETSQYQDQEIINYKNEIFSTNIKTVICHKKEEELSIAIINLDSDDKLLISFDDTDAIIKDYYYTIIHCNADWTSSDLMKGEYIDGFTEELITDYEFSFNTIQKYTHYQFEFPSINIKPIISGNYIFKIYEKNSKAVIYKRFMVLETKLNISAKVRRATLAKNRKTKHEIDITITHPNLVVADPFTDIKVHIKQNNKEDNAITNLIPQFVKNDELKYDYEDGNVFWANNEFRHFDFSSLRYQSERIKSIDFDNTYNHVYLFNDKKRPFDHYSIEPDINGGFIIKSQEGWKSSIEADYAFVHFTLPIDYVSYGDLYLIGLFSEWQLKEDFKLIYNTDQRQYEGSIYLKQGYYNYHYALNDTTLNRIDISYIEGTHYQTRNDYYVYVYHRDVGSRYDRLVGFLKTSSKELF